jgi:hypothetical protein
MEAEDISEHKGVSRTGHRHGLWKSQACQSLIFNPKGARNIGLTAMQQRCISGGLFPAEANWIQTMTAGDVLKRAVVALDRTQEQPKLQGSKKRIAMEIFLEVRGFALFPMDCEVHIHLVVIHRQTNHLPRTGRQAWVVAHRRRLGQHRWIDMKKTVEGAAIKPIKSTGKGLFGLESHPMVDGHRMLMLNIVDPRFHLIAQRSKLARRQKILDHNKPIPLEIGTSTGFQPAPPSAKGFGKFHPSTVQLKPTVQSRMTNPRIPKALGARQQREHG